MAMEFRWLGRVRYAEALELQQQLVAQRMREEIGDVVLMLEHEPVITIGRTQDKSSLGEAEALGLEVVETNRGGQATFHGPGQLVGYPILGLAAYGKDLRTYLRALEAALIRACSEAEISAERREGQTGVWIENRKIASIGVGVRRWISMHGFAINVVDDVSGFDAITPCGITNVEMTSVERESGRDWGVEAFSKIVQPHLIAELEVLRAAGPPDNRLEA
ncbi:MAG: lipoyl(octanoyl) transferase [Verrucomicrobiales bacterium]|jgi:lipoyl(octanoyl) transferase